MTEATPAGKTCVVDLEALKQRCLGNLDLVDRVLRKFAAQLDADLVELERALQTSDIKTFALVAHRIKGMSANVEARDLYQNAAVAEQRALERCVDELPVHLQRMQEERTRIGESLPKLQTKAL